MSDHTYNWPVELKHSRRNGLNLAYRFSPGRGLALVYLGGFHSNMNGDKCFAAFNGARDAGHPVLCLDYSCHGESEGDFANGTISDWLADVIHLINLNVSGDFILCGSSMGGWISLLTAKHFASRVKGIVTIAVATDMTEKFIWNRLDDSRRNLIETQGFFNWESPYDDDAYVITQKLIVDGRKHLLLDKVIPITCPVRMLHGTADGDIAWENSVATMQALESRDVELKLFKDAGHRLADANHISYMLLQIMSLLQS
jgi:pimeloyl-ACP methyl ester carboxylesterase